MRLKTSRGVENPDPKETKTQTPRKPIPRPLGKLLNAIKNKQGGRKPRPPGNHFLDLKETKTQTPREPFPRPQGNQNPDP